MDIKVYSESSKVSSQRFLSEEEAITRAMEHNCIVAYD